MCSDTSIVVSCDCFREEVLAKHKKRIGCPSVVEVDLDSLLGTWSLEYSSMEFLSIENSNMGYGFVKQGLVQEFPSLVLDGKLVIWSRNPVLKIRMGTYNEHNLFGNMTLTTLNCVLIAHLRAKCFDMGGMMILDLFSRICTCLEVGCLMFFWRWDVCFAECQVLVLPMHRMLLTPAKITS